MSDSSSQSPWLLYITLGALSLAVTYDILGMADLVLLFILILFRNWKTAYWILLSYDLKPFVGTMLGFVVAFILAQILRFLRKRTPASLETTSELPKPLFFPARTSHTRLFPKVHSFSYSYLLVGIPVGWQGAVNSMLAADQGSHGNCRDGDSRNSCWYSIDAEDYLDRGDRNIGLSGKLKKFLASQGDVHEEYPFAYLITAPRFFGYSFNPVSFWYLYSAEKDLCAMILEVNNTFDERRMYLLKAIKAPENASNSPREDTEIRSMPEMEQNLPDASQSHERPTRFTNTWAKDFHVSPFNSRKGTYSLVAYDPLYPSMTGRGSVNNTITLVSSKAHSKIVARIFSEGAPVDPFNMDKWQIFRFVVSWWWVGFTTFPRIVREAAKLFFKRKLHVWFRPEPLKGSIGRHADSTETVLEASFRTYLRYRVESNTSPLVVKYTSSGVLNTLEETMISHSAEENLAAAQQFELRVLTPAFYSRFVRYARDLDAFSSEFRDSGTIWLSEPAILPQLAATKLPLVYSTSSLANYMCFKIIQKLRKRPVSILSSQKGTGLATDRKTFEGKSDTETSRSSAMDEYILAEGTPLEQKNYRTEVLKVFVGDYIAFGSVEILKAELVLVKFLIGWWLSGSV